ncbi:hypothetical protein PG995_004804 [Apiospora arundinis]
MHGKYGHNGPQLDFDRLDRVHSVTSKQGVQLVLHGAGGFNEKLFRECIKHGMVKANVNDAFNVPFMNVLQEKANKVPLTTLLEEGTLAMQRVMEKHMDWMGSTGKAWFEGQS